MSVINPPPPLVFLLTRGISRNVPARKVGFHIAVCSLDQRRVLNTPVLGKCSWAFSGKSTQMTRLHQNFGAANQSLSTNLSTWTPISISNDLKNRCESYTKMVPSMPPAPHCGCDQGHPTPGLVGPQPAPQSRGVPSPTSPRHPSG